MKSILDNLVGTTLDKVEDSPIKNLLGDALKESLEKQKSAFEDLLLAKEQGLISQEDFEIEIEREKEILEAEILTKQIAAKAVIQKLVNDAIATLTKGLV
ncbi:hypothetical protein MSP8887_01421 [Marinomonas spartinae]|uniref:hypothetical protein n=1 Tax=Marinomonas spartinae TaxID=1792290 RepID=UPI000808EDB8|nr:hypothetical protein [Marinomonas spartinae]SBS31060.1 hypothetical protein MSP8887_01421 [Marinomonas spartinae]